MFKGITLAISQAGVFLHTLNILSPAHTPDFCDMHDCSIRIQTVLFEQLYNNIIYKVCLEKRKAHALLIYLCI